MKQVTIRVKKPDGHSYVVTAGQAESTQDQTRLQLTGADLDREIDCFVAPVRALDPAARRGWICGLGHGVLPGTPEASVRRFVERVRAALSPARG